MKIDNVSHTYKEGGNHVSVLNDIDLNIYRNEILCVVGKSGCGKTTLLKIIAGLISPTKGRVYINEGLNTSKFVDITEKPTNERDIGFVFQSEKALFPHLNVFKNVLFPFRIGGKSLRGEDEKERVNKIIARMGLDDSRKKQIHELSGGMKQRVAIARALVYEPSLLILDEPLTSLDNERKDSIIHLILNIKKEIETTIIHVTHDDREVKEVSDKVMVMKENSILRYGRTEKILEKEDSEEVRRLLRIE